METIFKTFLVTALGAKHGSWMIWCCRVSRCCDLIIWGEGFQYRRTAFKTMQAWLLLNWSLRQIADNTAGADMAALLDSILISWSLKK